MKQNRFYQTKPYVFRRWNNKGYSIFNSLKKSIVIGCLLVTYLLFANPNASVAQNDSTSVTKNYDLEAIDVTSEQLPETYSNISRVVVTISKSEIEQAAVSSINELLEYASNIDIRQRGINGIQADISIRGGSFDQVLVLLNGVNITDPQTGHHNLNLPLDLSSIERIEILKGPGAWKFGMGAFSGAINIITNTSKSNYLNFDVSAGQFSLVDGKVNTGFQLKNTSHLVSLNHSSSDGYVENTDYQVNSIFYHGKFKNEKSELNIQTGITDKGFGANSFYTAMFPNQYEEIKTYLVSASYKLGLKKIQIEPRLLYKRNNDRFVLFRDHPERYSNFHTSDVLGANFLANYIHNANAVTSIGIDHRTETIYSNNLGEITDQPRQSPVNDTITLNRYHSRNNFAVFAGHKRYFNQFMVNVGVNLTRNSDLPEKWFLFPGVDINYEINEKSSWFGSVNKTMRMPTFTDLYYQGPSNEGNSELLPEEALGYELGYKFQHPVISYSATGFYVQGKNLIDWVRVPGETKWKTLNYAQLNTYGFELYLKANLLTAFPAQSILKEFKLSYTNVNQNKEETSLESNYALNYLKHRIDFNLNHAVMKNLMATWHVAFQDRNGKYEKFENSQSSGLTDYKPFTTIDLKLNWHFKGWNFYSMFNNIFNISYYDIGNVPQPGRWVKFGVSKKIGFDHN